MSFLQTRQSCPAQSRWQSDGQSWPGHREQGGSAGPPRSETQAGDARQVGAKPLAGPRAPRLADRARTTPRASGNSVGDVRVGGGAAERTGAAAACDGARAGRMVTREGFGTRGTTWRVMEPGCKLSEKERGLCETEDQTMPGSGLELETSV